MGVTKETTGAKLAWAAALALYAACWVLPILEDAIGLDGARFAHEEFWKLLTEGRSIDSLGDVFVAVFIARGRLAGQRALPARRGNALEVAPRRGPLLGLLLEHHDLLSDCIRRKTPTPST
jgi:hypothetical protein